MNHSEDWSELPSFTLGDSPELSERLLTLVCTGAKTATCEALTAYQQQGESLPVAGQKCVILNWDHSPAVLIETLKVECVAFEDVEEDFALAEGENETLAGWRADHAAYFARNGGFSPKIVLVCEQFCVVRDLETRE